MAYQGQHPNFYDHISEKEIEEIRVLDSIIHRHEPPPSAQADPDTETNPGSAQHQLGGGADADADADADAAGPSSPTHVVLADDSSSDEDERDDADETTAMLEDAGLVFKRPVILQGGLKDQFQGRQAVGRFFDLMEENQRIDKEEANRPPPEYYWTPGQEHKYEDLGAWGKIKHNLHWVGYKAFWGVAFVGEVAVNVLGLDQPEYQWMLEEAEKDRKKMDERKRMQAQRRAYLHERRLAEEAEEGDDSESDESSSEDGSDGSDSGGGDNTDDRRRQRQGVSSLKRV